MQKRRRYKRVRFTFADLWALLLLVLILTIAISRLALPKNQVEREIVVAGFGVLEKRLPAQGLLVFPEAIITAPLAGEFISTLADGAMVEPGDEVGYLIDPFFSRSQEEPVPVIAENAGIYSSQLDGFEGVINAENIQSQDLGLLLSVKQADTAFSPASAWSSYRPLAKIISADGPFYLLLSFENNLDFAPSDGIWLFYSEEGQEYSGKSLAIGNSDFYQFILIQLETIPELLSSRRLMGYLPVGEQKGIIIPESAIIATSEGDNVYILQDGKQYRRPIKIIARSNGQAVVTGLKENEKIILPEQ